MVLHFLEPRSSKWVDGSESGGGGGGATRPMADASTQRIWLRALTSLRKEHFERSKNKNSFSSQLVSNSFIDFANERLTVGKQETAEPAAACHTSE